MRKIIKSGKGSSSKNQVRLYYSNGVAPAKIKYITPKICLSMIVRDEALNIERCLNSIKSFIHYWMIQDNGSTDGTQEIIRSFMNKANIPGELYETGWVNFSDNRNDCLEKARKHGDYILIMDADDTLETQIKSFKNIVEADEYLFYSYLKEGSLNQLNAYNTFMFSCKKPFKFKGAMHEMLSCEDLNYTSLILPDHIKMARRFSRHNKVGGMSNRQRKDLEIINEALLNESDVSLRAHYYRCKGDCHYYLQEYEDALKSYKAGYELYLNTGQEESIYLCLYEVALIKARGLVKNIEKNDIEATFKELIKIIPSKLEGPYNYIQFLINEERYNDGYLIGKETLEHEYYKLLSYTDEAIEKYKFLDSLGYCALQSGRVKQAYNIYKYLITLEDFKTFPQETKESITDSFNVSMKAFLESQNKKSQF